MGAPLEEVSEVFMADYPEAQPDDYFFSSESEEEGQPDMNELLLPEVVTYDYLQMRILGVPLNDKFHMDVFAPLYVGYPAIPHEQAVARNPIHIFVSFYHRCGMYLTNTELDYYRTVIRLFNTGILEAFGDQFFRCLFAYCVSQYAHLPASQSYSYALTGIIDSGVPFEFMPSLQHTIIPYPLTAFMAIREDHATVLGPQGSQIEETENLPEDLDMQEN